MDREPYGAPTWTPRECLAENGDVRVIAAQKRWSSGSWSAHTVAAVAPAVADRSRPLTDAVRTGERARVSGLLSWPDSRGPRRAPRLPLGHSDKQDTACDRESCPPPCLRAWVIGEGHDG